MILKSSFISFAFIFCCFCGHAQKNNEEEIQEIEPVVITGQYKKTKQEKSVSKIKVINREKINALGAVTLKDVLANEMNIRISQDNVLGSSMSLQGVSGQNVKILMDGVPLIGRLNGNIDISQINLNDIEQIEIVEGPLSVSYGTDALAGTINLISKKNKTNGFSSFVNSYYETIGQYNIDANIGYKFKNNLSTNISFGRNFFDGWNAFDPFIEFPKSRIADSLRHKQWKPKEQYFSNANLTFNKKSLNIRAYIQYFYEKITNRGYPRAPYNESSFDDYYHTWRINGGIDLTKSFNNKSTLRIITSYNNFDRIKNTFVKDLTTLNQILSNTPGSQDTTKFNLLMSRGTWSTASKTKKINYQLGYDINIESTFGKRIDGNSQSQSDFAFFASTELEIIPELFLKPALRATYNTSYNAPLIPSLNFKFKKGNLIYRASYARGFRAPSLKELYFDFVDINHNIIGNKSLIAEQSNNYTFNLTYKKRLKRKTLALDFGGFYNDIDNLITLGISPTDNQQYTYINIGEFKTLGSQMNFSFKEKSILINLGASYIGRYNNISDNYNVTPFSFSPELRSNIIYTHPKSKLRIAAFFKHNGKRPGFYVSQNPDGEEEIIETSIAAYNMLDINLSKLFFNKMEWTIGAKNILNVQDIRSNNTSSGVHSSNSGSIAMNWGRSFFTSIKFTIKQREN